MTDIVERLRAQRDHADDWRTLLCEDAAGEIERLRAALITTRLNVSSLQAGYGFDFTSWATMIDKALGNVPNG
jgi:hypothetical protein